MYIHIYMSTCVYIYIHMHIPFHIQKYRYFGVLHHLSANTIMLAKSNQTALNLVFVIIPLTTIRKRKPLMFPCCILFVYLP